MNESPKDDIEIRHEVVGVTIHMDTPSPPPPPGFISPFKSLQEWLFYLCDSEKPEKAIADLQFCLMESPANFMLSVDGYNKYDVEKDVFAHRIEFQPEHNFFPLPKEEYGNLSLQQLREQVLREFADFLKTDKFQNSFMPKAESIKFNFSNGDCNRLK